MANVRNTLQQRLAHSANLLLHLSLSSRAPTLTVVSHMSRLNKESCGSNEILVHVWRFESWSLPTKSTENMWVNLGRNVGFALVDSVWP